MSHAAHPSEMPIDPHAAAHAAHHVEADLSPANIDPPAGTMGKSMVLLIIGAVGLAVMALGGFVVGGTEGLRHAIAAYHMGVMAALAMCLGAMFWVLAFHLTQAGWSATLRRQFENLMSLTPIFALLVTPTLIIEVLSSGVLFAWLDKELAQHDVLLAGKSGYLNSFLFVVRAIIYIFIWSYLARRLWWYSTEQDRTGDKWLSNRARFTSAWGMLAFALSVAFAAFDWLMSLDYRFFSTMWGVYFFAGAAYSSLPAVVLVVAWLRKQGKLKGLVTEEHAHDIGKLMFGFTVFWAYITFSQYFLIWYANIPEETQFMLVRKLGVWRYVSIALVVGHFILPFYIMLWLFIRRSFRLLAVMAVWAILMQCLDMFWIIRPFVYAAELAPYAEQLASGGAVTADPLRLHLIWIDIAGFVGVLGLLFGLFLRKVGSGPLIPLHDPRLPEAVHHRNYV
jgi:hypothetical protein